MCPSHPSHPLPLHSLKNIEFLRKKDWLMKAGAFGSQKKIKGEFCTNAWVMEADEAAARSEPVQAATFVSNESVFSCSDRQLSEKCGWFAANRNNPWGGIGRALRSSSQNQKPSRLLNMLVKISGRHFWKSGVWLRWRQIFTPPVWDQVICGGGFLAL